jgi:hypothetical protein
MAVDGFDDIPLLKTRFCGGRVWLYVSYRGTPDALGDFVLLPEAEGAWVQARRG